MANDQRGNLHVKLDGSNQQRRILALRRIAAQLGATATNDTLREPLRDVYQFGVLTGLGLRAWLEAMPRLGLSTANVTAWGFDSFQGMPEESSQFLRGSHKKDPRWQRGGLNSQRLMHLSDWSALKEAVVRNIGFDSKRTKLIRGFFNESLAEGSALVQRLGMRPALLLDIDCDLYTSSKQALSFMLRTGLLAPGSFVYYDDYDISSWRMSPKGHPYKEERLAHEEITREFGLTWKPLFSHRFQGPLAGVSWIHQWAESGNRLTSRPVNKTLAATDLAPVLQLVSCARCHPS